MWNFFDLVRQAGLPLLHNPADAPALPGCYLLFSITGNFIYVGKAANLRERLSQHFGPEEPHLLISLTARYFIFRQTASVEDAEMLEGATFDEWVRATGQYPVANTNKPPRSRITDQETANPLLSALRSLMQDRQRTSG
jgi:hypothetical protein